MKLPAATDTERDATDIELCIVGRNVDAIGNVDGEIIEALQREVIAEKLRNLCEARDLHAMSWIRVNAPTEQIVKDEH